MASGCILTCFFIICGPLRRLRFPTVTPSTSHESSSVPSSPAEKLRSELIQTNRRPELCRTQPLCAVTLNWPTQESREGKKDRKSASVTGSVFLSEAVDRKHTHTHRVMFPSLQRTLHRLSIISWKKTFRETKTTSYSDLNQNSTNNLKTRPHSEGHACMSPEWSIHTHRKRRHSRWLRQLQWLLCWPTGSWLTGLWFTGLWMTGLWCTGF